MKAPQHQVSISTFFLGKYAVTQAQYQAVMGNNPSNFNEEPDSPNRPVENVSWGDAIAFCHRLSELSGKEIVYLAKQNGSMPVGLVR
jgi:eukaryotic-like serine/threonine-protein kinase